MLGEKKKIIFLFPIFILTLLGQNNVIALFIAVAYIVFLMLKNDSEHNYYLGLFLVPNIRIFDNIGVTFVVNMLLSLPLLVFFVKNGNRLDYRPFLWTMILFEIELCHVIILRYYEEMLPIISNFIGMLFCFLLSLNKKSKIRMQIAGAYFILGIVMSSVVYLLTHFDYATSLLIRIFMGERFSAYASDPNYFSLYICICLAFVFTIPRFNWLYIVLMFLLVICGLLTGSKMCLFMMSSIIAFGNIYNIAHFQNRSRLKFSAYSICLIILLSFCFFDDLMKFFYNFLKRAGLEKGTVVANELTSGRSDIIINYLDILSSNVESFFVGNGFKYWLFLNQPYIAHNTYLDIILSWGLLGFIFFFVVIFLWLKELNFQSKIVFYFPLIAFVVNLFDLSCLSATMFWWVFSFSVFSAQKNFYQEILIM